MDHADAARTGPIHVLGVPLRTGSLYPGSENDAQASEYAALRDRDQQAVSRLVDVLARGLAS
jgi:hypothetical protein